MKINYPAVLCIILLLSFSVNCRAKTEPDSVMDPCNTSEGFFKGGKHYIPAEYINEDGTINKKYKFTRKKGKDSECYPGKKSQLESIRKK